MPRLTPRYAVLILGAVVAVAGPAGLAAQEGSAGGPGGPGGGGAPGTVTGRVVDRTTGHGVPLAQVRVLGTAEATQTGDSGYFRFARVPAGRQTITALRLGFTSGRQEVSVVSGQTVTATIRLEVTVASLSGTLTLATGQTEEKRQQGLYVPTLSPDSLQLAATADLGTLLEGKIAGVDVENSSGTVGGGVRIRIRGANSASLSNEPLIVMDGIEVNNEEQGFHASLGGLTIGVGGQQPSRVNDIDPNEIETLETLQGPTATGLYGTQAANGVLVITTKHGQAGAPIWNWGIEYGTIDDDNDYPLNYSSWQGGNGGTGCTWLNGCTNPDSVTAYQALRGPQSPIREGRDQVYHMDVGGGNDVHSYFLSGTYNDQTGTLLNNALQRVNSRGNFVIRPRDDLSISFSGGWEWSNTTLPQNDNNLLGVTSEGLLGYGSPAIENGWYYEPVSPPFSNAIQTSQGIQRITPALNATYTPLKWLSFLATGGMDLTSETDEQYLQPNILYFGTQYPIGIAGRDQLQQEDYTLALTGTATVPITHDLQSATSLGATWRRELLTGNFAFGAGLLSGTSSLAGATSQFAADEVNQDQRTLGAYLQEQLSWRNRLFVTGGVRVDKTSTRGPGIGATYYPEANASYIVSDESFFPKQDVVTSVKLRSGIGQSGLRPTETEALSFYNANYATTLTGTVPAPQIAGIGNGNLKPEISTEYEFGGDFGFLKNVGTFSVTYYHKQTHDAIVAATVVPSAGASSNGFASTQYVNVGQVLNRGWEFDGDVHPIRTEWIDFDLSGTFSTLENYVMTLGDNAPIIFGLGGNTQEITPGRQLGAYFAYPYTYGAPSNGQYLRGQDLTVGNTLSFMGNDLPTIEASVHPTLTIHHWLRFATQFDYKGGYNLYNSTQQFRCAEIFNCYEDYNPQHTSLQEQAADVGQVAYGTAAGFFQNASFWKWREVSVEAILPYQWAQFIHARAANVTFAARNLRTWTRYQGLDPEVQEFGQSDNFTSADFLTQPPVRYYSVRFNLTY
jgi:TonB-dependent starch-binding outer membrane protein SusC